MATKRPNGLGGSLIYVSEETAPTPAPTQAPSPTPVIQYVPIGPGMPGHGGAGGGQGGAGGGQGGAGGHGQRVNPIRSFAL